MTDEIRSNEPTAEEFFKDAAAKARRDEENAGKEHNTWQWSKIGQVLQGRVVRGDRVSTNTQKGWSFLLEIAPEGEDEIVTLWCSSTILEGWIIDEAPAEGSWVYVEYLGKQDNKAGTYQYNVYSKQASASDFPYWHNINQRFHAREAQRAEVQDDGGDDARKPAEVVKTKFGPDEAPF